MAGILKNGLANPTLTDDELAKPFGYKAEFTKRYRSWLHKTGLAQQGLPIQLTPMGKIVWEHDPALESLTTQWFIHWELTQDPTRTETWYFFANEFLPQHETFTKDELLKALEIRLAPHSEKHFGPGSKLTPVIVRKLVECYTESKALGLLGLLSLDDNGVFHSLSPHIKGPWSTPENLSGIYS
ncbi:MAG: DUF4007 family protein [Anaerolineae bacterium]|nr:DUF4007 family protein [Anaerolineae bacterium]